MEKHIKVLQSCKLFKDISEHDIKSILKCLDSKRKSYEKNDIILLAGSTTADLGVVLSGTVQVVKEDINGNRAIITNLVPSDIFAEVFASTGVDKIPVTVIAQSDCEILFINFKKILFTCYSACKHHRQLIENVINLIVHKNIMLNSKIEILSQKTIRERILVYMMQIKMKTGKNSFLIPFSREELADYLCINRSALSRELSNMQEEGILKYNKNKFEIL